ncbi:MAG: ABC transporter permease subunit [Thermoleophilia bacterium]
MSIYLHEFRQNRNAAVIWAVSLIAIAVLYISIYPSISKSVDLTGLLDNLPEAYKKLLGVTGDFLSAFSSLWAVVLNLVLLAGAVQAMNLGNGIVSKEVRDKTADFLLTKPISRRAVLAQKLLLVFTLILMTNLVFLTVTWVLIRGVIADQFPFTTFLTSSLALFLVQAFFVSLGFLLGAVLPKVMSVIAVSLPVVFGFYVVGMFDTVVGLDRIKFMTPFRMFNLSALTAGGAYESKMLAYLAVLIGGAIIASFVVYQQKDIHTI